MGDSDGLTDDAQVVAASVKSQVEMSELDHKGYVQTEVDKLTGGAFEEEDGHVKRTGTMWTASAHIITAVIGSGVLSLAWGLAQLGWVFGPLVLVGFAAVTLYTSYLLADAYRAPNPDTGKRSHNYMEAVETILGGWQVYACGAVQHFNLVGTAIGYTVTAGVSMVAVARSDCFRFVEGSSCHISNNIFMIIFGAGQLVFAQVPDFDRLWWLSIVAAVMSLSYSSIGLGLCVGKATGHPNNYGSGTWNGVQVGIDVDTWADKVWAIFNGFGDIAFAYSFANILIEIQDTIAGPPSERFTMKRATTIAISTTSLFYMSVGVIGYAAFGNQAPGNLLTGFGFYNPYWLVDIANLCVVIHLFGAYQVFSQPFFAMFEATCLRTFPTSKFLRSTFRVPFIHFEISPFRLIWRSIYVCLTTLIAMLLPFFNDILGVLGALGFWPLTVYFPVEMHIKQFNVKRFSPKWLALQSLSLLCLGISIAALVGSIEYIKLDLKSYKPFHTNY